MCTSWVSQLTILLILLSLLFPLFSIGFQSPSHRLHTCSYTFIVCVFLLGFLADTLPTLSLHVHKHLTLSSCAPLPHHCPLPRWLAPFLCSAVKLVHWGSRKWGLETIEWREVEEGSLWCSPLKPKHDEKTAGYCQIFTFNLMWDMHIKFVFKALFFKLLLEHKTMEFPHLPSLWDQDLNKNSLLRNRCCAWCS